MGEDVAVSLDLNNYELAWPTSLFVSEGERIIKSAGSSWEDRAEWLMTEALSGSTAVADFGEMANHSDDPWTSTTHAQKNPQHKRDGRTTPIVARTPST